MEVHHHSHHPKKWKEYITEFLMLFLAVTLGFLAENLREQQIEKHREISYLKNVHDDLQLDLTAINNVLNQNTIRLRIMDTLFSSISNNTLTNEDVYYYVRNLALRATFESSHIGLDQIKSAGGLRMIKNVEITAGIQKYERNLDAIEKLESLRERTLEQARFKMANVFDPMIAYDLQITQAESGVMRFKKPSKADPIIQKHRSAVNELINLISFGLNTNRYLNSSLNKQKIILQSLDSAIISEYGAKFH